MGILKLKNFLLIKKPLSLITEKEALPLTRYCYLLDIFNTMLFWYFNNLFNQELYYLNKHSDY